MVLVSIILDYYYYLESLPAIDSDAFDNFLSPNFPSIYKSVSMNIAEVSLVRPAVPSAMGLLNLNDLKTCSLRCSMLVRLLNL